MTATRLFELGKVVVSENGRESVVLSKVTPEMALDWASEAQFTEQRIIDPMHVKFLVREMSKGTFIEGTAIHFADCRETGRHHLVNGQHTLAAIVDFGNPYLLTIHTTKVDTYAEVQRLYYHHDGGKIRKNVDTFRAVGFGKEFGLNQRDQATLISTAPFIENGFITPINRLKPSRDEILETAKRWATEMKMYADIFRHVNAAKSAPYKRSAVASIGLVTFRYKPTQAREFWEVSFADDGLRQTDPRKKLHDFLFEHASRKRETHARKIVDNEYMARFVAACWNAFYKNKELKQRPPILNRLGPIKIAGTPYKGQGD